jgi:hypothetical protein
MYVLPPEVIFRPTHAFGELARGSAAALLEEDDADDDPERDHEDRDERLPCRPA